MKCPNCGHKLCEDSELSALAWINSAIGDLEHIMGDAHLKADLAGLKLAAEQLRRLEGDAHD